MDESDDIAFGERVRDLFRQRLEQRPYLVHLDEIDEMIDGVGVGARNGRYWHRLDVSGLTRERHYWIVRELDDAVADAMKQSGMF